MTKARDISSLIGSSGQIDNAKITLDTNEIPNLDAGKITSGSLGADRIPNLSADKITTGTFADARISQSSVSQHATSFDDNKLVNDISTLALRQASDANRSSYNTNSQSVDVFQDDTGIDTTNNALRNASEYVDASSIAPADTTINLGSEIGSGWSGADNGVVAQTATSLVDNDWTNTTVSWSNRGGDTNPNSGAGDVGEFGSWCTLYKASTFSVGAVRFWSGHGNTNDPLGVKDMAIYTSTDTTNGTNGTWTIVTPLAFDPSTDSGSDFRNRGQRTSSLSSNHFILSNFVNAGNASVSYSDTVAFAQLTGIKGIRFDIRTNWENGFYGNEKPHMQELQIFDDGGVSEGTAILNATGNFTGTTITAPSSVSEMGAIITYQDNAGTNALNTDIVLQLSADGGSNYSTATLTALPDFSTGIKMAKVNDLAVTAGTQLKYKLNFANQVSGTKEARIRGVALQY